MLNSVFEKPTRLQIVLSVAASCFALTAFGLFFADGVGDKGGDGLPAFKIAFDVMTDGLHFNARVFFAYLIPLICGAAVIFPFKEKKVYYAAAFLLLAAGIVIFCTKELYLTKYDEELADMYRKAGVSLAVPAITAGTFSLCAAALSLLRGLAGVKFAVKSAAPCGTGDCGNVDKATCTQENNDKVPYAGADADLREDKKDGADGEEKA